MYGVNAADYIDGWASYGSDSEYIDWSDPDLKPRKTVEEEYEPEYLDAQARVDEIFQQMEGADEATAAELFKEFLQIQNNEMINMIPIGTMYAYDGFQKNVHVEDAMWDLNSNYTVRMTENIWIEK